MFSRLKTMGPSRHWPLEPHEYSPVGEAKPQNGLTKETWIRAKLVQVDFFRKLQSIWVGMIGMWDDGKYKGEAVSIYACLGYNLLAIDSSKWVVGDLGSENPPQRIRCLIHLKLWGNGFDMFYRGNCSEITGAVCGKCSFVNLKGIQRILRPLVCRDHTICVIRA